MNTLLIYTGGTIGMVLDEKSKSLKPDGVLSIKNFLIAENLTKGVTITSTKNAIDSSNFDLKSFRELTTVLEKEYNNFDNFLILMGTDTMAYISSLLSYSIEGLKKAIVFTGGQYPLFEENSDSKKNLKNAILGLQNNMFLQEVGIFFCEKWHRAVCTTKIDTEGLDAYASPNCKTISKINNNKKFNIVTIRQANIAVVKLIPFENEAVLNLILSSNTFDGIVLEVFGAGNMPDFSKKLKETLQQKITQGLKVVIASQCLKGSVAIGKYASSIQAKELCFINGGSMTVESIIAKMLYLHNKKLNLQEYKMFFETSIRGER